MSDTMSAMDYLKGQLSDHATDFEVDSDSDGDVGFLYLTLATDSTEKEYLGKQNSAVCLEGDTITEFDLRVGTHDLQDVERAVQGTRYAHYAESIDTGHGPKEIPHIRAFNTHIPIDEFIQFVKAVVNRVNR